MPEPPKKFDEIVAGGKVNWDEYNDQAFKEYNEKALVPCDGCGRTFLPDSLIKHQKGCKESSGYGKKAGGSPGKAGSGSPARSTDSKGMSSTTGSSAAGGSPQKSPRQIKEPDALVCYICGGKFGSASLKIHIP